MKLPIKLFLPVILEDSVFPISPLLSLTYLNITKCMYTYFGRLMQLLNSSKKVQVEIGYMLDEFSMDIAFRFIFLLF